MLFYIDPGTGSMLFTILLTVIGSLLYFLHEIKWKLQFYLGFRGQDRTSREKTAFVIFSDHKRYWNIFEPICDEFEKRKVSLLYLTASSDDPALEKSYEYVSSEFIGEGNIAYARLNLLRAWIVLATTPGLDVYQWKRSKNVSWYVHIPHAANDVTGYRMFGIDYYDAILLSGQYQAEDIRELERLRNLPAKELVIAGIPYMDKMKERLAHSNGKKNETVTVLLAPSWGDTAIFKRYGGRIIDALLATGYHLIIRPHPQSFISEKEMMEQLASRYPATEQLEWNQDNENFDVLQRSDILVSDFSGVLFDYTLVYDKPIIYMDISYDPAPYDSCWLSGKLEWTEKILPRLGARISHEDLPHIKEIIDDCLQNPRFSEGRMVARKETWANMGSGTMYVVDYLIDKYRELQDEFNGNSA